MHVLLDQSVVSMSTALVLVVVVRGLNSVTIIHRDIHMLSERLFTNLSMFQHIASDIYYTDFCCFESVGVCA